MNMDNTVPKVILYWAGYLQVKGQNNVELEELFKN